MVKFEIQVFHLRTVTITRKKENEISGFSRSLFKIGGMSEGIMIRDQIPGIS